jgi:VCBS repeat-containing protein
LCLTVPVTEIREERKMSWDEIIKGTSGSDIINGGSGDDYLQGKAGGDVLDGGEGNDQLHGDTGDDFVRGGAGNDLLHGGAGTDSAIYSGSIQEYSFALDGENRYVSHSGGSMADGYDRLISIERLVFADAVIDLTKNNAPIAFDDSATTDEDSGAYSGSSVLTNDFDWEKDNLTVVPGTFNGAYGTLVLNSNGTYTYTPHSSTQGLDDGETVQDSFTYTVSDGSLSDSGTLTITIAGRNDAPVANDDSAAATEESGVSGNVLANDTDADVEALTVANPGTYVGAYGTLLLAADGSYTYVPNASAQALDDGESVQDVFTYAASDGTASDSATLTVTVTGANDAPTANDDGASASEDSSASGNVLANDGDVDGEALTVANPGTYVGAYGTLVLAADGSFTYTPGPAAQSLDDGEAAQDSFSYVATDGTASDSATLTVTVTGANDAPAASDDSASASEDSSVSGNVLANDGDVDGEALTVSAPGTYAGAYGTLTLAADGSYTYAPNAAANGLAAGQSVQDVFAYAASDGTASDSASLTVTVTGANDSPTIDLAGTDSSGSVAELADGSAAENMIVHTDSGSVAFDDVDLTDTHTASASAQGSGYLGSFTLAPVDQNGDSVGWNFSVSDADLDALGEGEVVTQTYTITVDDGNGGTATQNVTITLTGASDIATWYIDNSAAGSANLGTEADPFTSIAAFNAAQGSPGGPAEGDFVALLFGTGIYAEADGINLLDGQVLTGIGDPTIAPTAGDGVNVGRGNSISGLNIASAGGDGIAGGDVGALSVSDVDITTSGGVGIEIGSGSGVSIAGSTIASGSNYAILAANVAGFSLTDSVVSSGSASAGTAAFTNLTGTADFLGNSLSGGGGDTLAIANGSGSLNLTIADSAGNQAVVGPNHSSNGGDGVNVTTTGGSLTLLVDGVDFLGAREDLLQVTANGSSTHDLTITGNNFANGQASVAGGGGVLLSGGGAGSSIAVDFDVSGNSFTGAVGTALAAAYTQQAGTVRGYIGGNVVGIGDGVAGIEGSSGFGEGITASLEKTAGAGDATYVVTIVDNEVYDVSGFGGIAVRSSGGSATDSAVMEATIHDNVVDELGDFALSALYGLVGGSGSGDFAELGLSLDGNRFDAGDADFGLDSIFLDQTSADAHFYVPGYGGSPNGEFAAAPGTASADLSAFWGANNVLVGTPFAMWGGVEASFVTGVTGEPLTLPAYFP